MNFVISSENPPRIKRCKSLRLEKSVYGGRTFTMFEADSFHIMEYHAVLNHGGVTREVRPGDWMFTPKAMSCTIESLDTGHHQYYHFESGRKRGAAKFELPIFGHLEERFSQYWQDNARIISDYNIGLQNAEDRIADEGLLLLFKRMHRDFVSSEYSGVRRGSRRSDYAVEEIVSWLLADLARPLDVEALSEEFSLSTNYMNRCFRQRYGMPVSQFFMQHRLNHARELIEDTTLPFKSIAMATGFSDPHHFNKKVRSAFGKSPTQIRKEHLFDTR